MCDINREWPINSQIKTTEKSNKKFFGILKRLAKFEDLLINKLEVIVCEGEIIEKINEVFIAPSMFINCQKHSVNCSSTEKKNENKVENLNKEEEILNKNNKEEVDYPDSSDFSDDDDAE